MTVGELLREYRSNQSKNLKTWVGNIISPSYYSKSDLLNEEFLLADREEKQCT
ncbi:XRE family transcriptional regulator [Lactobacillus sp. ESL0791]|uniref:XRE family transcriptional regulator n=1 Tax=Lactobacillus sp. ESL0791 TaxID=2983234 RepID=UPI0023F64A48|nr:XRE family transcriptional regulator [Lactobacillus sp. ESL0791]MDF7638419.1 XRE family transcriptional regulator [Lactobacillus sp. ESL0791]